MLICRNAEGVHSQRKVGNPCFISTFLPAHNLWRPVNSELWQSLQRRQLQSKTFAAPSVQLLLLFTNCLLHVNDVIQASCTSFIIIILRVFLGQLGFTWAPTSHRYVNFGFAFWASRSHSIDIEWHGRRA